MLVLLLTLALCLASSCYSIDPFWPKNFGSHAWGSAIAISDWLIVDGGEIYTTAPGNGSFSIFGSTSAIDLSTSWTNTSFNAVTIPKPENYPFARAQSMWYDPSTRNLFAWGGWRYERSNCPNKYGGYLCSNQFWVPGHVYYILPDFDSRPAQDLWQIPVGDPNGPNLFIGGWSKSPLTSTSLVSQPPPDSGIPFGALDVTTDKAYYSLGGCMPQYDGGPAFAYPGLLKLDLQTSQWSNQSRTDYGYTGYGAFGESIFVPMYGEQGVLVFFGGYAPLQQIFTWGGNGDPLQPLDQISIFDIAGGKFLKQTATGHVPGQRWGSCAVGVEDSNGGGFDIFLFGGFSTSQGGPYNSSYADVYVLSLPSFRWTHLKGSHASTRALHSCALIGKRQLVVVGGIDTTVEYFVDSPDPWENGIGVFDMAALRWSAQYNANAAPYERAPLLVSADRAHPYPSNWGDGVQQLFQKSSAGQNDSGSSSGARTIAGGVVGGISGLALVVALVYYFVRWRKTRRWRDSGETAESGSFLGKPELPVEEPNIRKLDQIYNGRFNAQPILEIGSSATRRGEARALTSEAQELEA